MKSWQGTLSLLARCPPYYCVQRMQAGQAGQADEPHDRMEQEAGQVLVWPSRKLMEIAEWCCGQGGPPNAPFAGREGHVQTCVEVPVDENLGTCTSRTPKKIKPGGMMKEEDQEGPLP